MDAATIRRLCALNERFYAEHAESFSATRNAPWAGWQRVLECTEAAGALSIGVGEPIRVVDLACGNLRFERFLADSMPKTSFEFHAIDNCPELAKAALNGFDDLRFYQRDVLSGLLDGDNPLRGLPAATLVACFGFMHHVPSLDLRQALLRALVGAAAPGGVVAISFWQFMDDERLAAKALATDALGPAGLGALETGDHFLGWQDDARPLRYCHSFSADELDELAASVSKQATVLARFSADGKSGALNRYLVLRRPPVLS